MNETKTTPEILAQLGLIQEKLTRLRELLNPIFSTSPKQETANEIREFSYIRTSGVMMKISSIKEQLDSIIGDIDIN